jgi:hypothetical protein
MDGRCLGFMVQIREARFELRDHLFVLLKILNGR